MMIVSLKNIRVVDAKTCDRETTIFVSFGTV